MTNPTQPGKVPEALRLADELEAAADFPAYPRAPYRAAAATLRTLHAQVAALTAAPNAKASIHALSQINAAQRELLDAMGAHTAQPAAEGAAKVNWWEVDGDKYDDSITRAPPAPTAQAAPAAGAVAGTSDAVAYLDIGSGGYRDIGTNLTDEALSRLPKGRHVLVIAGTYGVDGYVSATPTPAAQADSAPAPDIFSVLDAFELKQRGIPQAHIAAALVQELRAAIAARKQGGA